MKRGENKGRERESVMNCDEKRGANNLRTVEEEKKADVGKRVDIISSEGGERERKR